MILLTLFNCHHILSLIPIASRAHVTYYSDLNVFVIFSYLPKKLNAQFIHLGDIFFCIAHGNHMVK